MKPSLLIAFGAGLSACASTGPVVTNISYDAGGALLIEKCKVSTNFFLSTMQLEECDTHRLMIMPTHTVIRRVEVAPPRKDVPGPFQGESE